MAHITINITADSVAGVRQALRGVLAEQTAPVAEQNAPLAEQTAPVADPPQTFGALAETETALASDGKTMIPYDERIHTGGNNKITQAGKWAKKRGVDDDLFARVEAEYGVGVIGAAPAQEQPTMPPHDITYASLSEKIAEAMEAGVNVMDIFRAREIPNIIVVSPTDTELVHTLYADIDGAMPQ